MKTTHLAILSSAVFAITSGTALAADVGDKAKPLQIAKWIKGKPVDMAKGKGKNIYVVEFWATWCPPCVASIPHLTAMQKKYAKKGVTFISITDEAAGTVQKFVDRQGDKMDFTVAIDKDGKTSAAYMGAFGVGGIPHAFIVDKAGDIVWHGHPMDGLEQTIDGVLDGTYDVASAKLAARVQKLIQQYFTLAQIGANNKEADKIGTEILAGANKNAPLLSQFAWAVLSAEGLKYRDRKLAVRAAKAAHDLTDGKDADVLDTYARALFDTRKAAEAVKLERQALKLAKRPELRAFIEKNLAKYQAAAEKK